jgi:hypothetical protein
LFSISGKTDGSPQNPPESPTPAIMLITRIHWKNEGGRGIGEKLAGNRCQLPQQSGSNKIRAGTATVAFCDRFTM